MIRTFDNYTLVKEIKIIQFIADHLSKQNTEEAHILFDAAPLSTIIFAQAEVTETGFVLFDEEGVPHGIGGILMNKEIWFLMTEESTQNMRIGWLKHGRKWFTEQLQKYKRVYGYCHEKNELSMKWMRWFGFDFAPVDSEATSEINGHKFLYFQKNL